MAEKLVEQNVMIMIHNSTKIDKLLINSKKSPRDKRTRGFLDTRMESLLEYWNNYTKSYDFLTISVKTENLKSECNFDIIKNFENTEENYLELKTWLKDKLYEIQENNSLKSDINSESSLRPKLPTIAIPQFSGDYNQWMSFRDLFCSLIHCDDRLSKIEKHHYLKSCLTGEAEQLLKNYSLTEANYDDAWKKLNERYENKRVIVNNILRRFLNQKNVTFESAKGIKDLLDTTSQCLTSLKNLDVDSWNAIVVHIIVSKLDIESHKLWEQSLENSTSIPTYDELNSFLEKRFRTMEMVNLSQTSQRKDMTKLTPQTSKTNIKSFVTKLENTCTYCTQNHYICHCKDFALLNVSERQDFIKKNNICFNCLVKGHSVFNCRQSTVCKKCGRRHHTLLHYTTFPRNDMAIETEKEKETTKTATTSKTACNLNVSLKAETKDDLVILATAEINVASRNSGTYTLRALVDQGSQGSFISEAASQLLNLDRTPVIGKICGISNSSVVTTKSMVTLTIHSTKDDTSYFEVNAYVLKKLTSLLPSREFSQDTWPSSIQLDLADPNFHKPGSIDILLGADVHAHIILEGLHKYNSLIAVNSRLGWLISGKVSQTDAAAQEHNMIVTHTKVEADQLLRRFWEIEENLPHKKPINDLEIQCEEHFRNTHTRDDNGRYIVRLPFKDDPPTNLGDTKPQAISRLKQAEKRFAHKPKFKEEYHKFMNQYESQGHMTIVPENEKKTSKVYYLPHHAVLRPMSLSTKLRVVFDGSAVPERGKSLNDELLIGCSLQQDIRDLITRWRLHKICLVADIQKMYRQILVSKDDVDYQRILWREFPTQPIEEYRLLTVTYGISCAPFLAIRTLHQLAEDEKHDFPIEAEILKSDLYMDDLMTGASTEEDAVRLQKRLTELLARGGFPLHKWASNSEVVLSHIPENDKDPQNSVNIKVEDTLKTLGITWNPQKDNFELNLNVNGSNEIITKRNVLSTIAKTFDPLGWLAPGIILLKVFMQKLWLAGIDWDEDLPTDLKNEWNTYLDHFTHSEIIQFPRWLGVSENINKLELHGFSDASCAAYAGVVYLRVWGNDGVVKVYLVMAKSKVAPVKQISLPRLELCGAVLLAKVIHHIKTILNIPDSDTYLWTDSTIVLAWLRKTPNAWTTFVANRTSEILTYTNSNQWYHVSSTDNPADLASRGILPSNLPQSQLWWNGPKFLWMSNEIVHSQIDVPVTDLEVKVNQKIQTNLNVIDNGDRSSYLKRISKLSKLIRVTAYCLRFVKLCKAKVAKTQFTAPVYLSSQELNDALNRCIKLSQSISFSDEIFSLSQGEQVHKSSKIYVLNPFLDDKGIIRVGGRIVNAEISNEMKNPILLSNDCALSKLIVLNAHLKTLHGGHQLTLNFVRQKFWIVRVKNIIKTVITKCIPCFKQKAKPLVPFMANLPNFRVKPSRPFLTSGVDFAGPFTMKLYPGRCKRTCKSYVCLFVCTVTKAIHLELVTDLTSAAFIAAFRRFTARRGHCKEIWSDRGTNFVGASRELDLAFRDSKSQMVTEISELLANDQTQWKFIPPGAPHFGGIWESGVKSVKGHLKRVIGQTFLTYEELSTLLSQVEACVNSRPLTLVNSTLDEPPLTPGHFLVGEPLIGVPEPSFVDFKLNNLNRWNMIQRMVQCLWQRWQNEYLTTLQHRYKWNKNQPDVAIGTVVLVKDDRLPPGKWLLGRIIRKHPGPDGITRVVTLQYKDNTFKRPIAKLCPLPLDDSTFS